MNRAAVPNLLEIIKVSPAKAYFCAAPFHHVYNDNAGPWRLCCHAHPFEHTVSDTTPLDHMNHPLVRKVRREMLSGNLDLVKKLLAQVP
jgi:hypothetical protein